MIASNLSASFSNWYHSPPVWLSVRSSKWTIGLTAFGAAFTVRYALGFLDYRHRAFAKLLCSPTGRLSLWLRKIPTPFPAFADGQLSKIVPVLPFSLTERSGVPEEDGMFYRSFNASETIADPILQCSSGSRYSSPFLVFSSVLALVSLLNCSITYALLTKQSGCWMVC